MTREWVLQGRFHHNHLHTTSPSAAVTRRSFFFFSLTFKNSRAKREGGTKAVTPNRRVVACLQIIFPASDWSSGWELSSRQWDVERRGQNPRAGTQMLLCRRTCAAF